MPENFLERVRQVVGPTVLPDMSELDPANDLHVDRAAVALVRRFKQADDLEAYSLLLDLTAERLGRIADAIVRELGLAEPFEDLVLNYFENLFVDMRPAPDESAAFLRDAAASLREGAEIRIRDIALSSARDPEGDVVWDEDVQPPPAGDDGLRIRAARICFHRLDQPHRRVLRAKQIDDLSTAQIAAEMSLSPVEAEALLHEAAERLEDAIDRELKGGSR